MTDTPGMDKRLNNQLADYTKAHGFDWHIESEIFHVVIPWSHPETRTQGEDAIPCRTMIELRNALGY